MIFQQRFQAMSVLYNLRRLHRSLDQTYPITSIGSIFLHKKMQTTLAVRLIFVVWHSLFPFAKEHSRNHSRQSVDSPRSPCGQSSCKGPKSPRRNQESSCSTSQRARKPSYRAPVSRHSLANFLATKGKILASESSLSAQHRWKSPATGFEVFIKKTIKAKPGFI